MFRTLFEKKQKYESCDDVINSPIDWLALAEWAGLWGKEGKECPSNLPNIRQVLQHFVQHLPKHTFQTSRACELLFGVDKDDFSAA